MVSGQRSLWERFVLFHRRFERRVQDESIAQLVCWPSWAARQSSGTSGSEYARWLETSRRRAFFAFSVQAVRKVLRWFAFLPDRRQTTHVFA